MHLIFKAFIETDSAIQEQKSWKHLWVLKLGIFAGRRMTSHWMFPNKILPQKFEKEEINLHLSLHHLHEPVKHNDRNRIRHCKEDWGTVFIGALTKALCLRTDFSLTVWLTVPVRQKGFAKEPVLNQPLKSVLYVTEFYKPRSPDG